MSRGARAILSHYFGVQSKFQAQAMRLPPGRIVLVPKATPRFTAWAGESVTGIYKGKPVLDVRRRPAFAALAALLVAASC